jgi:CRP-like cAMP-binding protein
MTERTKIAPSPHSIRGHVQKSSNRIIAALSETSRRSLWSSVERIETSTGQVLGRIGESISHFYFVESGMVSLMKSMQNGAAVEISTTGPEGIAPPEAIFDLDRAVFESIVLIPGKALRIRREELSKRLANDRELWHVMRGYAGVALNQLAQTAACNILHSVEERCCRWLLTAHDTARARTFSLTHEFLGAMLGVRRASVSVAAQALQRAGVIQYCHGQMTILDRAALERAACECYAATQQEFESLFQQARYKNIDAGA